MSNLLINQADLIKLWQQVRSSAKEQSKDFGDVALQFYLAKRFRLIDILYHAIDLQKNNLKNLNKTGAIFPKVIVFQAVKNSE